jgi:hypothetical protein
LRKKQKEQKSIKYNEDERIRKYLIEFVKLSDNPRKEEMITYLEKQKEQKPAEWSEEDENNAGWIIAYLEGKNVYHSDNLHKSVIKWLRDIRDRLKKHKNY